uniref:Uncharacterized protein n=1 Tax=Parascaris univalens TaxID=6257 RepID=A0A915A2S2_PARUN
CSGPRGRYAMPAGSCIRSAHLMVTCRICRSTKPWIVVSERSFNLQHCFGDRLTWEFTQRPSPKLKRPERLLENRTYEGERLPLMREPSNVRTLVTDAAEYNYQKM